jgi:hypothetical protein
MLLVAKQRHGWEDNIKTDFRETRTYRLREFENRIIFGSKREEVVGGWRRLNNENLHNLYASPNIIRVIKSRSTGWAEDVAHMEEMRNAHKVLVGKAGGKRPLGTPRRRWEDNIRMDLREIGWEGVGWMHLVQGRDQ